MATVQISLTPDAWCSRWSWPDGGPRARRATRFGCCLRALQFLADAAITFFLLILPILIVIAIPLVALFLLLRFVVRRLRASAQGTRRGRGRVAGGRAE